MGKYTKKLVAYYSNTGNTKFLAEHIANAIDADLLELTPKKKMNVSGTGYFGWGIRQLVSKSGRELEDFSINVDDYDLVIVGTPVWTYTLTPPIRTFFAENNFSGKDVAVFCSHDGNPGKTLDSMKKAMSKSHCIGEIDFRSPLKNDMWQAAKRAEEWGKSLEA